MEELILKERKFKEEIVKAINNSNLPAFILKPTIKEVLVQIESVEQQQYEEALRIKQKKEQEKEETKEEENKEEEE